VPVPECGGDQGLPGHASGIGAAWQQPGIQHDVGDTAAGAQRPVRAHRRQHAAEFADRALAGVPPRPQRLAAARAAQLAAGQGDPGRRRVEDLDHRPSRQDPARPSRPEGGSWCCSLASPAASRNLPAAITMTRHRSDASAATPA
jgi:hypothetical protein